MILNLSKQTYDIADEIVLISDVDLVGVTADNFELYEIEGQVYTPVTFVVGAPSGAEINIIPNQNLTTNKAHLLVCKSLSASTGELSIIQLKRFFSVDQTFTRNYNDVYYQLKKTDNILDLDKVVTKEDNYDFSFYPTKFNPISKKYEYENYQIDVNNTDIVLENYINQYFSEFGSLFYNLKDVSLYNPAASANQVLLYDEEYINNINLTIMKNINKFNALKGNRFLVEYIIGLYSKILGYNLISVIEDTSNNFVYRISASLPSSFWTQNIKPIVHPIGWNDIYNEITSQIEPITVDWDAFKADKLHYPVNTTSYLDAEYYTYIYNIGISKNVYIYNIKRLYHLQGGIEATNAISHAMSGHSFCSFRNLYDERKFNINFSGGIHYTDYTLPTSAVNTVEREVRDFKQYKTVYDALNDVATLTFKQAGIATSYIWEKFRGNKLIETTLTAHNRINLPLNKDEYVLLTVKRNGWGQKCLKYDLSQYIQYKSIMDSWNFKNNKKKFTHVRNFFDHYGYDGISYDSFNSEKTTATLSQTNDFTYTTSAAEFTNEFDLDNSIPDPQLMIAHDAASASDYGYSVKISKDGNTLLVGAPQANGNRGYGYVYTKSVSGWDFLQKLSLSNAANPDRAFVTSCISDDGSIIVAGSPRKLFSAAPTSLGYGAATIFTKSGTGYVQTQQLAGNNLPLGMAGASQQFGNSITMSHDGQILAIAAYLIDYDPDTLLYTDTGLVHIFTYDASGQWVLTQSLHPDVIKPDSEFGRSISMSSNGDTIAIGAHYEDTQLIDKVGAVFIFTKEPTGYKQLVRLKATEDDWVVNQLYGNSVCLSSCGNDLVVGAPWDESGNTGKIYIYKRNNDDFELVKTFLPTEFVTGENLGFDVQISSCGNFIVARTRVSTDATKSGVYTYEKYKGEWYLKDHHLLSREITASVQSGGIESIFGSSVTVGINTNEYYVGSYTYDASGTSTRQGAVTIFNSETTGSISSKVLTYTSGSVTRKKIVLAYKKPGIALKYDWKLYISGKLVKVNTTYFNETEFDITATELQTAEIKLTLHINGVEYPLTNTVTF